MPSSCRRPEARSRARPRTTRAPGPRGGTWSRRSIPPKWPRPLERTCSVWSSRESPRRTPGRPGSRWVSRSGMKGSSRESEGRGRARGLTSEFDLDPIFATMAARGLPVHALRVDVQHAQHLREVTWIDRSDAKELPSGQTVYEFRLTMTGTAFYPELTLAVRDANTRAHLQDVELHCISSDYMNQRRQPGPGLPYSAIGRGLSSPIAMTGAHKAGEPDWVGAIALRTAVGRGGGDGRGRWPLGQRSRHLHLRVGAGLRMGPAPGRLLDQRRAGAAAPAGRRAGRATGERTARALRRARGGGHALRPPAGLGCGLHPRPAARRDARDRGAVARGHRAGRGLRRGRAGRGVDAQEADGAGARGALPRRR